MRFTTLMQCYKEIQGWYNNRDLGKWRHWMQCEKHGKDEEEITSMNIIFLPVKDYRFCNIVPKATTMKPLALRARRVKRVSIIS